MKIDIFRDGLFESLKKYNDEIITVCDRHKIHNFPKHKEDGGSAWWFDPRNIQKLHLTTSWKKYGKIVYPEPDERVYDKKFCLIMYVPNYLSLWLTNKLFDNKEIMFEDLGCGLSHPSFYLSKLGFKNFSFVENFTHLDEALFKDFMKSANISYVLNEETKPTVTNIVGHHPYPKEITRSTELFITYVKDELVVKFDNLDGYTFLCEDSDGFSRAYARNDKYEEFKEKLS